MTYELAGIYSLGKITLLEIPPGLRDGPVKVLLMEDPVPSSEARQLLFGEFPGGTEPTEEDFKIAEWRPGA